MGVIEVDIFSKEVNSTDHPEAEQFRLLLEQVADDYNCDLLTFEVKNGTASFSFNNDELMADILKILQNNEIDDE